MDPSAPGVVVGYARRVQRTTQFLGGNGNVQVLDFALQTPASDLYVQMRGTYLEGVVNEGDVVEVSAPKAGSDVIRTDYVYNRSLRAGVRMLKAYAGAYAQSKAQLGKGLTHVKYCSAGGPPASCLQSSS